MEKALLWAKRHGIPCRVDRMCSGHVTLYFPADTSDPAQDVDTAWAITSYLYDFARKNDQYHFDRLNVGFRLWLRADYDAAQRWHKMRRAASDLFFIARNPDHYTSEQRAAAEDLCRSFGLEPVLCAAVGIDAVGMEV